MRNEHPLREAGALLLAEGLEVNAYSLMRLHIRPRSRE